MRSISPLSLPSETNITYHLNDSPLNSHTRILPPIPVVEPSSSYSDTVLQENVKDSTLENRKAWSSLTGKYMDTTSCNIKSNNTSRGGTSNSKTKNNQNGCSRQRRLKKRADLMSDKTIERYCCTTTFGLGVFLKVDSLYPGQSFVSGFLIFFILRYSGMDLAQAHRRFSEKILLIKSFSTDLGFLKTQNFHGVSPFDTIGIRARPVLLMLKVD